MGWMSAALNAGKKVVTQVAKEKAKEKVAKVVTSKFKKKKAIPIKTDKLLGEKKGGPLALKPKAELVPSMKGELTSIPEAQSTVDIQKFVGKEVKSTEIGKDNLGLDIITKTLDSIVESIDKLKDSLSDRTKDSKKRLKKQLNALKLLKKRSREEDLESDSDKTKSKKKKGFNLAPEFDFLKTIGRYLKFVLIGTLVNGLFTGNQLIIKTFRVGILAYFAGQRLVGKFVGNIVKTIGKSLRGVTRPFRAMGRLITRSFRKLGSAVFKWVDDAVKMLAGGIRSVGSSILRGGKNVIGKAVNVLSKTPIGKAAGKAISKGTTVAKNILGKGGKLLRRGKRLLKVKSGRLLQRGSKIAKNVIGKGSKLLRRGKRLLKVKSGRLLQRGKGLLSKGAKALGKTGAAKGVGKVSSTLAKWFGPGVAKMMSKAKPLFKTIAKGAKKGIKIPFLGPILVAITSILAGEPIGKTLFKTAGTAIGGTLGMALAAGLTTATAGLGALVSPALMIVGELIGEFLGNALYDLTLGGGIGKAIGAVKDKVGEAIMKVINIPKWIGESTERFFTNFPSIKVPAKLGLQSILGKIPPFSFFAKEGGVAGKRVTKLPDLSLFIPILGLPKLLKHLKNSFFPPKGGDAVGGDKGGTGGGESISSEKKVSGRFDIETGKAFINEKEVDIDEYTKFQNLSMEEKIDQYGVDPVPKNEMSSTKKVDTESISDQTSYEQASNTIVLMQPPAAAEVPTGGGTKTITISPDKISLVNSEYEMSNTIKSYAL